MGLSDSAAFESILLYCKFVKHEIGHKKRVERDRGCWLALDEILRMYSVLIGQAVERQLAQHAHSHAHVARRKPASGARVGSRCQVPYELHCMPDQVVTSYRIFHRLSIGTQFLIPVCCYVHYSAVMKEPDPDLDPDG